MKHFGSAAWNGDLREGKGSVSTESPALETYPYTLFSRYREKPGTNPEGLIGPAHAACFKACAHSAHQRNWYILNRETGDAVCNLHRPARPQRRRQVPLIGGIAVN
jgi:organic hydroperoxide reductase OsmC/OhrA